MWFVWKGAHFFMSARFKLRKLTFLRLYPTNFHQTKCIACANMSTFHKDTAYLNPMSSICKHSKQINVSVNTSNIAVVKTTFASNVCKYCKQNLNMLYMYVYE